MIQSMSWSWDKLNRNMFCIKAKTQYSKQLLCLLMKDDGVN